MKTILAAAVALAMGTGMAFAGEGEGGPLPPTTSFAIWQQEGAAGKPLTPTSELLRMADKRPAIERPRAKHSGPDPVRRDCAEWTGSPCLCHAVGP